MMIKNKFIYLFLLLFVSVCGTAQNRYEIEEVEFMQDSLHYEFAVVKATQKLCTGIVMYSDTIGFDKQVVMVEDSYLDGYKHGVSKANYLSGQLAWEYNYLKGRLEGKCLDYYQNGQLEKTASFVNDLYEGEYKEYTAGGELKSEVMYHQGTENGYFTFTGDVRMEVATTWENGAKKKIVKNYYNSGKLASKMMLLNEMQHGESLHYYENGEIKYRINHQNNLFDGESSTYYEDGGFKSIRMYNKGEADGESRWYDEEGKLTHIETYKNGTMIGEEIFSDDENQYFERNPDCDCISRRELKNDDEN